MIGKATVAVIALIVLFGIIAARVPSEIAMLIVGLAGIVVVFGYLFFLAYFVAKHPDIAATEGPSYVQSKRIALAAKGIPKIPFEDAIPDPQNPTLLTTTAVTPAGESSDG